MDGKKRSNFKYFLIASVALPFAFLLMVSFFDVRSQIVILDAKIDSIQKNKDQDTYSILYSVKNNGRYSRRVVIHSELCVVALTVKGYVYGEKHTEVQPLAVREDALNLTAKETQEVRAEIIISEKQYAKAIGAVSPPELRVSIKSAA